MKLRIKIGGKHVLKSSDVNAITQNDLENTVYQISPVKGEKYYVNPSTFNQIAKSGVFKNYSTQLPAKYRRVSTIRRTIKKKSPINKKLLEKARKTGEALRSQLNKKKNKIANRAPNNYWQPPVNRNVTNIVYQYLLHPRVTRARKIKPGDILKLNNPTMLRFIRQLGINIRNENAENFRIILPPTMRLFSQ